MCDIGVQVRGLAHPAHWQGPQGAFFDRFGAVKATARTAYRLLRNKESVLLFPGGGREVRKLNCCQRCHWPWHASHFIHSLIIWG